MSHQKGLDLLNAIIPKLMDAMKIQVVILGTGEQPLQWGFSTHAARYPGRVGACIGFSEAKARLIYAGSDAFVIPSRFEPCGLSQMYAMRYGTLPLARATGGLADTIEQYQQGAGAGTGFLFNDATADALYNTIGWACATWYDRRDEWKKLQQNAMAKDFGWEKSAKQYEQLYAWAIEQRLGKQKTA
jgi:starch synthase